jgi:hypothetical protein
MTRVDDESGILICTSCGAVIDLCAFCERAPCPEAICYRCLRVALGDWMAEPHTHGG